jgi:EmrB/QacA subfamily drug resistance transporter
MKPPCDEAAIRSASAAAPCRAEAAPWILAAAVLGSSMAFLDSTIVNVALPALQTSLGATVVGVQWVVESYGLFLGALILAGGSLGDVLGRRLMFLVGVGIFAIASAGCGLASNIQELLIARSVEGVGAAFLVPGSLAIISASFDDKTRGQAIGTWSGFTAITTAIGPVIGGWLIEHASWRWAFFLNLPLAAAVIAISLWRVPESRSAAPGRVDWLGAIAATVALGGVVSGLIASARRGWTDPLVLVPFVVGSAGLFVFYFVETRVGSPMVPVALFESRTFSGANLLTLFLYAALGIFFFVFPLNLIQVQGYSATATGAAALPFILLMFSLSRWAGGLVTRFGPKAPLTIGPLFAATGFLLFALPSTSGNYWTTFFPAFVVLGFGMAVSVAPLTTVVMGSVDHDRAGTASGINNAVARVASVLAIAVFGIVIVSAFSFHLNHSMANLSLSPRILHTIQSNEINLADLQLPAGLTARAATAIRASVSAAFVFGFRLVTLICAGLSAVSALFAWRMIPAKPLG